MVSKNLKKWLTSTFTKKEISFIPKKLLNKVISLSLVQDIQSYILDCKKKSKHFKVAGAYRRDDWEKGWSGDGVYNLNDEYHNLPYYFKKNQYVRLNGKLFKDENGFTEVDFLRALQIIIFKKYLPPVKVKTIIEYGCGTGHNIQFLRKNLSNKYKFFGADWAISAKKKLIENKILQREEVFLVDFFNPHTYKAPNEPYIAFTNASLEQTGANYKKFMNFLIKDHLCQLGVHIEPIRELLDTHNPLNLQSFDYQEKRGYLKNFISYLRKKNLDIKLAKDFGIGSSFLSGYQVVVWARK